MRDDDLAAIRLEESHDVAQRDRLADPAAADDRHRIPGIHVKIGIDQNRPVECFIHMPELDVVGEFLTHAYTEPIPREYSRSGTSLIRRHSMSRRASLPAPPLPSAHCGRPRPRWRPPTPSASPPKSPR